MGLDPTRKTQLATAEMSAFLSQTGHVKAFERENGNYSGQTYLILKDVEDPDASAKAAAVHGAVRKILDAGVKLPGNLRVYCTKAYAAQNRAFSRDGSWSQVALVILGPAALTGGRADALSASGLGGCNKPTITCIHEIGHILHERSAGDGYWERGSTVTSGAPTNAGEVSGYAAQNKKEFVAEVFAGLILGKGFSKACLKEYRSYGGPKVP